MILAPQRGPDMGDRGAISLTLRFAVLKRAAFSCTYCGRRPPWTELQVDHIRPVAEGGETHADNLVAACVDCNSGKGASDLLISRAEHEAVIRGKNAEIKRLRSRLPKPPVVAVETKRPQFRLPPAHPPGVPPTQEARDLLASFRNRS